jgi:hypothetical protein
MYRVFLRNKARMKEPTPHELKRWKWEKWSSLATTFTGILQVFFIIFAYFAFEESQQQTQLTLKSLEASVKANSIFAKQLDTSHVPLFDVQVGKLVRSKGQVPEFSLNITLRNVSDSIATDVTLTSEINDFFGQKYDLTENDHSHDFSYSYVGVPGYSDDPSLVPINQITCILPNKSISFIKYYPDASDSRIQKALLNQDGNCKVVIAYKDILNHKYTLLVRLKYINDAFVITDMEPGGYFSELAK